MTPPTLSPLALRLGGSPDAAWHVHHLATERVRRGEDVIVLSIGEPEIATPSPIAEAMAEAVRAGRTRYTAARGEPELLDALAARASRHAGRPVATDRLTFLPGAQSALFAVLLATLGDGDEAIVPEPVYAPYLTVLRAAGCEVRHVPLPPGDGFHPRLADIEAATGPRTRVVLLTSPHNPTGSVLRADELAAIGAHCRAHGLWLVVDEVYADFAYAHPFASALALEGAEEHVAVVSSLSKSHAMTGFRHGWAVTPVGLGARIGVLAEAMLFGCAPFVQDAGLAALDDDETPARLAADYARRIGIVVDGLAGAPGVAGRRPDGGMFILVDVRRTGLTGEAFALRLLEEEAVSVLPTDAFGPSGAGHVRISLGAPDATLAEAARRIAAFAARLAG